MQVVPGFNYLLHVSLKQVNGTLQKKTYNLTFENNVDLKELVRGELDLLLANNHTIYRTMPLVINAEVRLCGNIYFHYVSHFNNNLCSLMSHLVFLVYSH